MTPQTFEQRLSDGVNERIKAMYPRYNPTLGTYAAFRRCAMSCARFGIEQVIKYLESDEAKKLYQSTSRTDLRGPEAWAAELKRVFLEGK